MWAYTRTHTKRLEAGSTSSELHGTQECYSAFLGSVDKFCLWTSVLWLFSEQLLLLWCKLIWISSWSLHLWLLSVLQSSVPGWSSFMSARTQGLWAVFWRLAKCSSGVLCPVQLHTYVTSKAESMTQDLQRAACILCAWEAPRHKLQCSVGSRYAQRLRGQHTTMGMQLYEPTLSHLNQTL